MQIRHLMVNNDISVKQDFSKIYSIYFPKLVRFSHAYILSEEDAENIVQDIFLYLWVHKEMLDSLNNLNAFLFSLAKNKCVDYLRHQVLVDSKIQEMESIQVRELSFKLSSLQQFDENLLSSTDIELILDKAINNLPEKCRQVFILSRMEGLKHKEIASRMDISVKTVENHLSTALNKLKVELKDYLPLFTFIV